MDVVLGGAQIGVPQQCLRRGRTGTGMLVQPGAVDVPQRVEVLVPAFPVHQRDATR
jgi:hypothetical protein